MSVEGLPQCCRRCGATQDVKWWTFFETYLCLPCVVTMLAANAARDEADRLAALERFLAEEDRRRKVARAQRPARVRGALRKLADRLLGREQHL